MARHGQAILIKVARRPSHTVVTTDAEHAHSLARAYRRAGFKATAEPIAFCGAGAFPVGSPILSHALRAFDV